MFELQRGILSTKSDPRAFDMPLLVGLATQTDALTNLLLAADGRRYRAVPWVDSARSSSFLYYEK